MTGCNVMVGIGVFISAYLISIPISVMALKNVDGHKYNVIFALVIATLVGVNVDGTTACSGDDYAAPEVTGRTMR